MHREVLLSVFMSEMCELGGGEFHVTYQLVLNVFQFQHLSSEPRKEPKI